MAVTKDTGFPTTLRDLNSGTANLSWTAFTTPGPNRFLVAMFLGNGAGTNAINSFTSPNLTWTNRVAAVIAGNTYRVEIWTAFAASVVTGEVITSAHITSGCSYSRRSVLVFSCAGSNSSGNGNTASNITITTNPTLTVTATATDSLVFVGFPYRSSGNDVITDGTVTSEYDAGFGGGFGFNERAGSRASTGAGSLTLAWSTGDPPFEGYAIGGIEVLAAGGGSVATVPYRNPGSSRPFPFKPGGPSYR